MLWLITRNPWVGVFSVGFCIGITIMKYLGLTEEIRDLRSYTLDLEKQIVALRSTIHNISIHSSNNASDINATIRKEKERFRDKNEFTSRSTGSI